MKALFIKIIPYVTVLLAMIAWGIGYAIYGETLIDWWEPLSMALILAIATLFLYKNWQWLTRSNSKILNQNISKHTSKPVESETTVMFQPGKEKNITCK